MTTEQFLWLIARALPGVAVIVMGFLAARDANTRSRWTQLLYQTGSLKPEQRDDPKVQQSVRFPFWIVGLLLLWWPVSFYRHSTRTFEISTSAYAPRDPKFDANKGAVAAPPTPTPDPYAILTPQPAGAANAPANPAAPNAPQPAAPPSGGFNPYGGNAAR